MFAHSTIRSITTGGPAHRALTYPLYARQFDERIAAGEWFAIEAQRADGVVGLILVSYEGDRAEVLSIAVTRELRRQGIASDLLAAAASEWTRRGGRVLGARYRADLANAAAVEGLLKKNGWTPPMPSSEVGRSTEGPVAEAVCRFAKRFPIGFGANVVAWNETTPVQRAALEAEQLIDPWAPRMLMPGLFTGPFSDDEISSAVLSDRRIVGWMLVRVAPSDPPKADFCCAFVHPHWQRRGTFLWMLARSLDFLGMRTPRFSATWTVAMLRPEVRAFIRRRLGPLGVEFAWHLSSFAPGMRSDHTPRLAAELTNPLL